MARQVGRRRAHISCGSQQMFTQKHLTKAVQGGLWTLPLICTAPRVWRRDEGRRGSDGNSWLFVIAMKTEGKQENTLNGKQASDRTEPCEHHMTAERKRGETGGGRKWKAQAALFDLSKQRQQ